MTRLLLIRHGETDMVGTRLAGRMPGVRLNEAGRAQADKLPLRLRGTALTAIYSSPLERARETAEPLARQNRLTVQVSAALAELDYGEWTGRSFLDLEREPLWKRFNGHRSGTRVPGGESMLETQVRTVTELERLQQLHDGSIIAVVSHAEWIRCALLHYLGMSLDLYHRLEISPASVTTVDLKDWGATIQGLNAI